MVPATIALVSGDAALTESIQRMTLSVGSCRFVSFPSLDCATACATVEGVAVLLVHMRQPGDSDRIRVLLEQLSMARKTTAIIALSDKYEAAQALSLLRIGVADYYSRPLDIKRLAFLVDVLTARARYTRAAPAAEPAAAGR